MERASSPRTEMKLRIATSILRATIGFFACSPESPSPKVYRPVFLNGAPFRVKALRTELPFPYSCASRAANIGRKSLPPKRALSPAAGPDGSDAFPLRNLPPSPSKGSCCVLTCPERKEPVGPGLQNPAHCRDSLNALQFLLHAVSHLPARPP